MKHNRKKHTSKERDTTADIIPMSNDPSLHGKSNNELDDYKDNDSEASNYSDYSDDSDYSDYSDSSDDEDNKRKSSKKKHSSRKDEYEGEEELTAPNIKSKKAKPRRGGQYSNTPLSELKREQGVQQLHDKLNNNLHQIQIAIPYGQGYEPQRLPPTEPYMTYSALNPKVKTKWWKTKKCKYTLTAVVLILVIIAFSWFVWKYIQAVKKIEEHETNILIDNEYERMNDEQGNNNPLDEREYNQLGANGNYKSTKGGNKSVSGGSVTVSNWKSKLAKTLPRDSKGRFVKRS